MRIGNKILKSNLGMTLLELVLAMSMLAVIAVGSAGMMRGVQALAKRTNQQVAMQQDAAYVFKKFERYILERQYSSSNLGLELGFEIQLNTVKDAFQMTLTTVADPSKPLVQSKVIVNYSRNKGVSTGSIQIDQPPAASELMVANGFHPWARLKDYNGDGKVDQADVDKRNTCLADFTQCFARVCNSPAVHLHFPADAVNLMPDTDASCIDQTVFPVMEVTLARDMIYFSAQPARVNALNQIGKKVLNGMTKAISLLEK